MKGARKVAKEKGTRYCLNCGQEGDFSAPCSRSPIGSHRTVTRGTKKYRVRKIGGDGYIYLFTCVPKGYELVEEVLY